MDELESISTGRIPAIPSFDGTRALTPGNSAFLSSNAQQTAQLAFETGHTPTAPSSRRPSVNPGSTPASATTRSSTRGKGPHPQVELEEESRGSRANSFAISFSHVIPDEGDSTREQLDLMRLIAGKMLILLPE